MSEHKVVVVGQGGRTAVGMTSVASAAAVRAAIAGFGQHPFMVDTAGKRMIVASAPYLTADVTGVDRLAELALPAVAEALNPLISLGGRTSIPVFVGLPPDRPGRPTSLQSVGERIASAVVKCGLAVGRVALSEVGHASGMMAVQSAWEAIRAGNTSFALAGGVDSYLEPDTLEWLEANDQLHSAGPANNPYGFVPGEAGGFVLLASSIAARRHNLTAAVELSTTAFATEHHAIKTESICLGEGLTTLFRALEGTPQLYRADHLFCDMNGEPYRSDEFGFATIRAGNFFVDPSSFSTPADCWGDVGAASGPLFVMLADAAARKRYSVGPVVAGFTGSESGERCGFVVRSCVDGGLH